MAEARIKLYAMLARYLPAGAADNQAAVAIDDGMTVGRLLRQVGVPGEHCHLVLLNGVYVPPAARDSTPVTDGDAVAVWPPVAGG